jgi:hypothetical protein
VNKVLRTENLKESSKIRSGNINLLDVKFKNLDLTQ